MAIKVKKLVRDIRNKVKDLDEVTYSDFDIQDALNECISYFNMDKALRSSDFLEKRKYFNQEDMNAAVVAHNEAHPDDLQELYNFPVTGVELPDDLVKFVDIIRAKDGYHMHPVPSIENISPHTTATYKVTDGRIYTNTDFYLLYRGEIDKLEFEDLSSDEAEIALPLFLKSILVKITVMILTGNPETDTLMQEINRVTNDLVPGRRVSGIKARMPFKV